MPPAIIAAGVGAAASIGGSVLANKSQKKATNQAVAAQTAANDQAIALQKEMFDKNSALYEKTRAENVGFLQPYSDLGLAGAQARNALLGLPTTSSAPRPATTPALATTPSATATTLPAPAPTTTTAPVAPALTRAQERILERREDLNDRREARGQDPLPPPAFMRAATPAATSALPAAVTTTAPGATGTPTADAAFKNYLNSAGYQFQYDQGIDAMEHALRLSSLDSGAAIKSAMKYGTGLMGSYFDNYMNMLGQQQGMGLTAAGNIAGMNSNYASNMANMGTGFANNAGNIGMQNGSLVGNAALANGANNANMWGNIANGVGQIGGALGASSFRAPVSSDYISTSPKIYANNPFAIPDQIATTYNPVLSYGR